MNKSWNEVVAADRPEHVNVYISKFGPIPPRHHIHHIDNNHENNDPNNLMALPRIFHNNLHSNYAFYYNLASKGKMSKRLLQAVLEYYHIMGYSLSKKFATVFVEYLTANLDPDFKLEPAPVVYIDREPRDNDKLKKVRKVLAPFHKQNDLLFGSGGIYDKLSKKQADNCLRKVLKAASELYLEIKESQT